MRIPNGIDMSSVILTTPNCLQSSTPAADLGKLSPPKETVVETVALTASRVLESMPPLGFGTFIGLEHNKIEDFRKRQQITSEAVFEALKAGCRHLDCASEYGNLEAVGNALKKAFLPIAEGGLGLKREDVWITSKDSSSEGLDKTLRALGTDYLDLYLIHYPEHFDKPSVLEGLWKKMHLLVDTKRVRNIGVSNCYRAHLERLLDVCMRCNLHPPYANEIEIHPFLQEQAFVEFCQKCGIRLIAYSPLGYASCSMILESETLAKAAIKWKASAAQVALAWNMARGVSVIPSSRKREHIISNCQAAVLVPKLSEAFMKEMSEQDVDFHVSETSEKWQKIGSKLALDKT